MRPLAFLLTELLLSTPFWFYGRLSLDSKNRET